MFRLQVKYSLADRSPEKDGLLAKCKELGVTLIAHSPLAQGLLTGVLTLSMHDFGCSVQAM